MKNEATNKEKNRLVEFSPEKDPFYKSRQKGTKRWILKHLFHKSNKYIILVVFFTTILAANLSAIMMILIGNIISDIIANEMANLFNYITIVLILSVGTPILRLFNYMLREVLAQRMERDVRKEFYTNLLGKSQSFHDRQKIGEIMARATDDVRMLNFLVSPAISLVFESFTNLVIPFIYILLFYPAQLIFFPLIFTVLFFITLRSYSKKIGPVTRELRSQFGKMNNILNETLNGMDIVKSTTQEATEAMKYYLEAKSYKDAFVKQGNIQAKYLPIVILAVVTTFALGHAIILYLNGIIDIGQIISYFGLLTLFRFPTNISIFVFAIFRLAGSSSERLLELMNQETEIDENIKGIKKEIQGKVSFKNLSFSYPGSSNLVLKNINFKIESGKTVAIVGTTGSGKTTLTKLISRLYDPIEGKILIDDIDIRKYSLNSLRSQISYIEQDVFLYSTSIIDNITFGRESSNEDIIKVAKQAQAHDFILNLPEGYDSKVGERGVQLSGGERQRIALARAFLTNPSILILDDSTSAIDSETEDKIQTAIKNILRNRTTFLITHRLAQIRWADLIIVLKKGVIVAKGTHQELLKTSEEYKKIFVQRFDVNVDELLKKEA
ncbi:MAG: ATP-binding cassette domain-containing protein [Candidatus Lokiarchaeota archaeon]|nr:ATP-binding cassette domain-containing protein [Candidatus Lokiarchaeota archaeon]MBD3338946.1 ATP-binding cassette domain-containing protein [Candidatus Lokiarchaeota archaeon]